MSETLQEYKKRIATAGGLARAAKLSPEHRTAIAKLAAKTRHAKKKQS